MIISAISWALEILPLILILRETEMANSTRNTVTTQDTAIELVIVNGPMSKSGSADIEMCNCDMRVLIVAD